MKEKVTMITINNLPNYKEHLKDIETFKEYAEELAAFNQDGISWTAEADKLIKANIERLNNLDVDKVDDNTLVSLLVTPDMEYKGLKLTNGDNVEYIKTIPHRSTEVDYSVDVNKKPHRAKQSEVNKVIRSTFSRYVGYDDSLGTPVFTKSLYITIEQNPVNEVITESDNNDVTKLIDFLALAGLGVATPLGGTITKGHLLVKKLPANVNASATNIDLRDQGFYKAVVNQPLEKSTYIALVGWFEDAYTSVKDTAISDAIEMIAKFVKIRPNQTKLEKAINAGQYDPDIYGRIMYDWMGCEKVEDKNGDYDDYAIWWLKALLFSIYSQTTKRDGDPSTPQSVFWLFGGQGLGKSTLANAIGLGSTYAAEADPYELERKGSEKYRTFIRTTNNALLTTFDDAHIVNTSAKLESVKNLSTTATFTTRDLYRNNPRSITNRMTWLSTSNETQEFMSVGEKGTRRFIPLTAATYSDDDFENRKRGEKYSRQIYKEIHDGTNTTINNLWHTFYIDVIETKKTPIVLPFAVGSFPQQEATKEVARHTYANELNDELETLLTVKLPVELVTLTANNLHNKFDKAMCELYGVDEITDAVFKGVPDPDKLEAAGGALGVINLTDSHLQLASTARFGSAKWADWLISRDADSSINDDGAFKWTPLLKDTLTLGNPKLDMLGQEVDKAATDGLLEMTYKSERTTSLRLSGLGDLLDYVTVGDLDILPKKVVNDLLCRAAGLQKRGSSSIIQKVMENHGYHVVQGRYYMKNN